MTWELQHPIEDARNEPAWTFPPNTSYFVGTQRGGPTEDSEEILSFHYLYIRVKRASKYWDSQWDDIINEATEHLNRPDKHIYSREDRPKDEVLGADNPYVILTVGLEVRLFKWEQGHDGSADELSRRKTSPSSSLREFIPGKVLSICRKNDREEITKLLIMAEIQKEYIKAKFEKECEGAMEWYKGIEPSY